ncbi:ComEC/Rec2 family competence protein [Microbacterium sp. p3-SID336]|uniref:ComEC/Rec2 family competence protein n=1 Tax=Microbacterium sp. p3-SID336 TaxID=2916212 RepID=UPI0021A8808F|nr:ComEC/Rec2 family competence protein [Microbacterium sp. p3-SID336]MCT1478393.1 ComEC/Rec2 family competence protein [Microbacterium sp. p3-SID336]
MKGADLRVVPVALGAWVSALLSVLVPPAAWASAGVSLGAALVTLAIEWWQRQATRASPAAAAAGSRTRHGRRGRATCSADPKGGRTTTAGGEGAAPGRASTAGLIVLMCAAASGVAFSAALALPAREAVAAQRGRVVEAVADVASSASVGADGRLWFDAVTSDVGPPGHLSPVTAPIRVGVAPLAGVDLGARIRVVGETVATGPEERAALVLFASTVDVAAPATGVFGIAANLRRSFVSRATELPEPGSGLLPGLAVGDTTAVSPELDADMRTSGLSHLTAVSGANCAIVVGAVFGLTALCGGGRRLRILLAAASLAGFVVLVTPEPSVIRAAVMAGAGMLGLLVGRPSAGAGILAVCVVAILLGDPWLASTPGFALSVAASGALVLLAPPLAAGLGRWLPVPLAVAVAVPLSAQLACAPIIALFAAQQSLVGVVANLIAEPAAPVATVIGLLACLTAPIPLLADLLAAAAWLPAAWIATVARTTAELPGAAMLVPPGIVSALLVAAVSASIGIVCIGPGRMPSTRGTDRIPGSVWSVGTVGSAEEPRNPEGPTGTGRPGSAESVESADTAVRTGRPGSTEGAEGLGRIASAEGPGWARVREPTARTDSVLKRSTRERRPGAPRAPGGRALAHAGAVAVLVVTGALGGSTALLDGPLAAATTPESWTIAACDVGQGDALVVRSAGAVALIDTGPAPEPLAACLRSLGVDRIDLLVLTHFDLDHAGGLDAVRGRVATMLHGPPADARDRATIASFESEGARAQKGAAGQRGDLGDASWRVLWPLADSVAFPPSNDTGVVVEFRGGGVPPSLFLADLSAAPQRMLQRTARLSEEAVVKVAHHGSADQDAALYEALRPKIALISVGADNDYGHPRGETLDLLAGLGARVLRTDQCGRILVGVQDGALAVWTDSVPP